jgi:hypothetical protein
MRVKEMKRKMLVAELSKWQDKAFLAMMAGYDRNCAMAQENAETLAPSGDFRSYGLRR